MSIACLHTGWLNYNNVIANTNNYNYSCFSVHFWFLPNNHSPFFFRLLIWYFGILHVWVPLVVCRILPLLRRESNNTNTNVCSEASYIVKCLFNDFCNDKTKTTIFLLVTPYVITFIFNIYCFPIFLCKNEHYGLIVIVRTCLALIKLNTIPIVCFSTLLAPVPLVLTGSEEPSTI